MKIAYDSNNETVCETHSVPVLGSSDQQDHTVLEDVVPDRNQSINNVTNQSTKQPINQQCNQSVNNAINHQCNQSINKAANQSTMQPINNATNQSTMQSIN